MDGIRAYAARLAEALDKTAGVDARWGKPSPRALASDVVLLQYNPFSYGRWGFAPGIVFWSGLPRWRYRDCVLVLTVHEPYVAGVDMRTRIMRLWQRPQLFALRCLARSVIVVSHDAARRSGVGLRTPVVVPVGSNMPDGRAQRAAARESLGAESGDVVLVVFAASSAGRAQEHVLAAVRAVIEGGTGCILLALGVENVVPDGLPSEVRVHRPGYAPEADLARLLAAGDIFVAPFVDGISTRRTGLMAALQHGLAVVGTTTPRSDPVLLDTEAIVGIPVGDVPGFGRAVARLAADPSERARRGAAARCLYETSFSWERIAEQVLHAIARDAA